jgi:hypothetical protein
MPTKNNFYPAVQLTDDCNKQCTACLRGTNIHRHKLTWPWFKLYLNDIISLKELGIVKNQFVTGGIAAQHHSLTTNGITACH